MEARLLGGHPGALARRCDHFTTDDVWDVLRSNHPGVTTHEPRAMGPMMVNAVRAGLVQKTNVARSSNRDTSHTTDMWVYRSLLRLPPYEPPAPPDEEKRQLRGYLQLVAERLRRYEPDSDLLQELGI